jgi:hypothetical protein
MITITFTLLLALMNGSVQAFSVIPHHSQPAFLRITSLASDFTSDFGSAMPSLASPYERIGVEENQLAMGVDAEEFIMYFGT